MIDPKDKAWDHRRKIRDRELDITEAREMVREVEKDLMDNRAIRIIGQGDCNVMELKKGDELKVFFGIHWKLVCKIEILKVS